MPYAVKGWSTDALAHPDYGSRSATVSATAPLARTAPAEPPSREEGLWSQLPPLAPAC